MYMALHARPAKLHSCFSVNIFKYVGCRTYIVFYRPAVKPNIINLKKYGLAGICMIATGCQMKIVVSACTHIELSLPSLLKEIFTAYYRENIACPTHSARVASHYRIIIVIMILVKSPVNYVFKVIIKFVFKIINIIEETQIGWKNFATKNIFLCGIILYLVQLV